MRGLSPFFSVSVTTKVQVTPKSYHAKLGETVIFNCISNKTVSWIFNERYIHNKGQYKKTGILENVLIISKVQAKDAGKYICLGRLDDTYFEDFGILTVAGKYLTYE